MIGSISQDNVSQQVQQRENEWATALLHKDLDTLESILASNFVLRTATGNISRAEWLKTLFEGMDPKALQIHDPEVNIYGDVAVVQGLLYWHVVRNETMPPDPRTGSREVRNYFVVTDIWVRREGHWQVVHRHSTVALNQPDDLPPSPSS